MNRYPLWKYVVIGVALLIGVFYTLPNFFAEVPAVQVSTSKSNVKIDASTLQTVEEALKAAGVKYQAYKYPGTYHGFHNDTTPRYNEAAAKLAWSRTLAFFKQHLQT